MMRREEDAVVTIGCERANGDPFAAERARHASGTAMTTCALQETDDLLRKVLSDCTTGAERNEEFDEAANRGGLLLARTGPNWSL